MTTPREIATTPREAATTTGRNAESTESSSTLTSVVDAVAGSGIGRRATALYRLFGNELISTSLPVIEAVLIIFTIVSLSNNQCLTVFGSEYRFIGAGGEIACREAIQEASSNCTAVRPRRGDCFQRCEAGNVCLFALPISFEVFISHYTFRMLAETLAIVSALCKKKYNLVETTPLSFEWQPIDLREQRFLCSVQAFAFLGVASGEVMRLLGDPLLISRGPPILLIVYTLCGLVLSIIGLSTAQKALGKGSSVTESGDTLMYHLMLAKAISLVWESWSALIDIMVAVIVAANGRRSVTSILLLIIEIVRTIWELQSEVRKLNVSYFEGIVIIPIGSGSLLKKLNNERQVAVAGNALFQTVILTTARFSSSAEAIAQIETAADATEKGPIGGADWRAAIRDAGYVRPSSFRAWLCIQATTDPDHIWVDANSQDLCFTAIGDAPGMIVHSDNSITVELRHRVMDASARVSGPIIIKNGEDAPSSGGA